MSDHNLIQPPPTDREEPRVPAYPGGGPVQWSQPDYDLYPYGVDEGGGVDLRRYAFALLRYRWLLALALLVGGAGAWVAWNSFEATYQAQGSLWIESTPQRGAGDVAPIRPSELLGSSTDYMALLRSYSVVDSVVAAHRLYVQAPSEYRPTFASFGVGEDYTPGDYELRVGDSGEDFVLLMDEGALVQQGEFGGAIGQNVGFDWSPAPGSFPGGVTVRFSVLGLREAANLLLDNLDTFTPRDGSFISVSLVGSDPVRITDAVNAIMERHVAVAADLKRARLDETLIILEDQLQAMELELASAEQDLEEFRVRTIVEPSDRSAPIAAGLEITTDPVMRNFFETRIQVDQIQRDRTRLQTVLDQIAQGIVRPAALEIIPPAAASSELRVVLDELVNARSELRALEARYSDEYAPIQDLRTRIQTIEQNSIPSVVQGIVEELSIQEGQFQGYENDMARELAAIPPRTIEEGRLTRRVDITGDLYNEIRSRVETARLAAASAIPDVRILDRASPPRRPEADTRLLFAAVILFGCLGVAMGGAILLDHMDAKFRYAGDVSRDIGLDILGTVPRIQTGQGRRGVANAAQALEAFRELRIHVSFAYGAAGPITLAVTSPSAGEGKSMIASNLAVAFSEIGHRTLLIDADTRRGDAHKLFARDRTPGLTDYLREQTEADVIQATDHKNLDFIGSGTRGVSTPELLASPRMAYFMGTLKRTYDVIIVDCPPLASGGDPLILGSLAGNLALVIRAGATEKALAQAKLDQLSRLPIRVLGAIINDISARDSYNSYYASYLPGYEPQAEEGVFEEARQLQVIAEDG